MRRIRYLRFCFNSTISFKNDIYLLFKIYKKVMSNIFITKFFTILSKIFCSSFYSKSQIKVLDKNILPNSLV